MSCDCNDSWPHAAVFTTLVTAQFWTQNPLNSRSNVYLFSSMAGDWECGHWFWSITAPKSNYFKAKTSVQPNWNENVLFLVQLSLQCWHHVPAWNSCASSPFVLLYCRLSDSGQLQQRLNQFALHSPVRVMQWNDTNESWRKTLGWIRMEPRDTSKVLVFQSLNTFWSHFLQRRHCLIPCLSRSISCFAMQLISVQTVSTANTMIGQKVPVDYGMHDAPDLPWA